MGNTYTVEVWDKWTDKEDYHYHEFWRGESFFAALFNLWKAKRTGFGCVKLEWR